MGHMRPRLSINGLKRFIRVGIRLRIYNTQVGPFELKRQLNASPRFATTTEISIGIQLGTEVNALKAARKGLRTAFSLSLKKIETELIKENIDMNQLSILKTQFMDKFQRLDTCQSQISEQLLDTEDAVQEYLDYMEDAENYRDRYIEMCTE
ncbi:uncharacterized protein TNCV_4025711 [Trichonephila clavipes]|nr:uncharacterized protein TNCV_4025711 [Trichonephila clavipes]